jgi:transposase-like protein
MPHTNTSPSPYYAMIRTTDTKFALRHNLVVHALQHGVRATARHFGCARNTVRKWLRRYRQHHLQGLHAHSRAPHSSPHKAKSALERRVVALRKKTPGFGARRLIAEFALPLGHNAVNRILRARNLTRRRKRRHQTKRDLRAIKAAYATFTHFRMDTKYLTDLPTYWPQMQRAGLPRFQTTIRELSCGAQFLAYSQEISKTYATLAADRFLAHLARHGIRLADVEIRTDLGSEFDGDTVHLRPDGFIGTIEQQWGARHEFNPPHCPNANADVETVHSTIEGEFYDAQAFRDRADFFAKATTYQLWYNVARKNSSRGWCSPVELLAQKAPHLSPAIFLLPPIPLEHLLTLKVGHDVPGHPDCIVPVKFSIIIFGLSAGRFLS